MPAPCLSVVTNDCISNAKDYNAGGARYNTNYIQGVGIGTVTDCITSVKYNVFDKKNFTMEELLEAMDHNLKVMMQSSVWYMTRHRSMVTMMITQILLCRMYLICIMT